MKTAAAIINAPDVGTSSEFQQKSNWLLFPAGVHRDSDALARSNHRVALRLLSEVDPDEKDHEVCRFGHWAVGWIDEIIVKPGTKCATSAETCERRLANYPILDESDHTEEEQTEADETWANCYNDRQRLEYIRDNWSQFEHCHARWYPANEAWRNLLDCVRGRVFYGYASELLA
jgi:hypothetical protein